MNLKHKVLGKTYKQRGLSPKNKLLDVLKDLAVHPETRRFIVSNYVDIFSLITQLRI